MESRDILIAAVLLLVTFNLGLAFGDDVIRKFQEVRETDSPEQRQVEHEHALFYVIVDGEELSFLGREYQLNRRDVHLEGNRSDIVHKHYSGVTWRTFMDSINVSASVNGTEVCLDAKNISRCDEGNFSLNGEPADLSKEIQQGDNLVITLGENAEALANDYSSKEVPDPWQDPGRRGRQI